MSGVYAGGAATIAAAKARRRQEEEEERMTAYSNEDLDGWEFKIVRSAFGRFRNYPAVKRLCEEEAKAGWEMVEKFDNYRIRFKRRIERRADDMHLTGDPYRTQAGVGEGMIAVVVIGTIVIAIGIVLFLTTIFRH